MSEVTAALRLLRDAAIVGGRIDAAARGHGLTVDRWRALVAIAANPGCSMGEVIEALVLPATTATRTVDALVDMGAVYRTPAVEDRRRVTLRVSGHGVTLLRDLESGIDSIMASHTAESVDVG